MNKHSKYGHQTYLFSNLNLKVIAKGLRFSTRAMLTLNITLVCVMLTEHPSCGGWLVGRQTGREILPISGSVAADCRHQFLGATHPAFCVTKKTGSSCVPLVIHCNDAVNWKMMLLRDLDLCGFSCTHASARTVHSHDS